MAAESGKGLLAGSVALITGGGTGIGKGIAMAFAREGAAVAITGRRREPLEAAVAEIQALGVKAAAFCGDVSKADDCQNMTLNTVMQFGSLSILVNNAGIARFGALDSTSDEDIAGMIDVNLRGTMFMTKYAIPELSKQMPGGGACVLNIGTSAALTVVKNFSVYASAKAALHDFTRNMALELSEHRIRVNLIDPGVVDTPIFNTMMPAAMVKGTMVNFAKQTPLGRVGKPEDIAEAALYLCSRRAEWVTGALLTVDGGISLT